MYSTFGSTLGMLGKGRVDSELINVCYTRYLRNAFVRGRVDGESI